jgi:argininosuccinate synthase
MEKYKCEVITVTVDVGLPKKDLAEAEKKSKKLGVLKHYTIDAKKEFVLDYIHKAIKANASYEGYPLSTALARPLTALKVVEVAKKENADALAHGATGKGNDQFRFERIFKSKAPEMKIIAPIKELGISRKEGIAYAKRREVPVPVDIDKPYSIDENLWGRSIEGGILEDPKAEPPEDIYKWKMSSREPEKVEIEFHKGVPIALNGEKKDPVNLIEEMNEIAGRHGIGRIDMMEDRIIGIKTRENYECPAAVTLLTAHKQLEQLILSRRELRFKEIVDSLWSELVYKGLWEDPLRIDLDAFISKTQEKVSGKVMVKLYSGGCLVISRESKWKHISMFA